MELRRMLIALFTASLVIVVGGAALMGPAAPQRAGAGSDNQPATTLSPLQAAPGADSTPSNVPPLPTDVSATTDAATGAPEPPPEDLRPLRVRIPGIDVDATVIDLGVNDDGTLEVPSNFAETGWFTGRAAPGEHGPSVVVGHVDSTAGPAVFYKLRELEPGDRIAVDRSDGLVAWFVVSDVILVDKDNFPTEDVYGSTRAPELRLITCGGSFDASERSYVGNVIVYADHIGNYAPSDVISA